MSRDLNQCNFIGRLGRNPDIRQTPGGDAVANFSIAVGDDYRDKSGANVERTNWVNVVAFGRLAEVIDKYLTKGSRVYVCGKQQTRKWQTKDGQDRYTTEIVATDLQMLDGKRAESPDASPPASYPDSWLEAEADRQAVASKKAPATSKRSPDGFIDDDEIPF